MSFKGVNVFDLPDVIVENAADADATIGSATYQPFESGSPGSAGEVLHRGERWSGLHNADLEAAMDLGIVVINVPDASVDEVSGRAAP